MAIQQITLDTTGEVGVEPRIVRIKTTDSFTAVTAANYLKGAEGMGFEFQPSDIVAINYGNGTSQFFTLAITSSTITLLPVAGNVTLPVTDGNIAVFDGTNGTLENGPVAANRVLTAGFATPDVNANLIGFDVTATAAQLAGGNSVQLINASTETAQYRIRALQINSGGTNFSGGGGNRLGQVTDTTTVYSVIPAASLQTLANATWGATALPFPASAAINTLTTAGADLLFQYSGGTTDYSAGSIVISGVVERIV
jgi:hypothetical protein